MRHWFVVVAALSLAAAPACNRPASGAVEGQPAGRDNGEGTRRIPGAAAAGATCAGRDDCASDQVCVDSVCRYRVTSRAGSILAAGARGQLEAGDIAGAVRTYEQALSTFEEVDAPAPPEIVCGAAIAALRSAANADAREKAAALADGCLRASLPGDALRTEVEAAIARLRFDGLDLSAFDQPEAPERFFTLEPTRPTADAINIVLDLAERDAAGYAQLAEALRMEPVQHAITDCFIQAWELTHERRAEAPLVLKFRTVMRDMGDYDTFVPQVEVTQTTEAGEGFEPCVATRLTSVLQPGPRIHRPVSEWQEPFVVGARIQ